MSANGFCGGPDVNSTGAAMARELMEFRERDL
jgi:hypothetical protein